MAQSAAHLVDRVIPRVPVRQWVLSFAIPLEVSAQASGTETRHSRHRRGHAHPEIRLGRQLEHPFALSGARRGLSAH
ncbi:MAG: hypothetical protein WD775_01940, partial [Burkholderiales bacterium]